MHCTTPSSRPQVYSFTRVSFGFSLPRAARLASYPAQKRKKKRSGSDRLKIPTVQSLPRHAWASTGGATGMTNPAPRGFEYRGAGRGNDTRCVRTACTGHAAPWRKRARAASWASPARARGRGAVARGMCPRGGFILHFGWDLYVGRILALLAR